jgi:hypothetical protein
MKRGIFLNLTLLSILVLLVALPFLVMFAAGGTASMLGCQMSGASMPDGFCGTLYAILTVVGWSSIAIVPFTVGALLLYLVGVSAFFSISQVSAWLKGKSVSPVAKGMMASTMALVLLAGCLAGGIFGANWFQIDFAGRCAGLPGALPATGKQNGPLALAVKVPADSEIESRTILAVTPEGELLFQLNKSFWGRSPAWSPDGTQLAFVSQDMFTRRFALHLVNAQGEAGPVLLEDRKGLESLSWAPDGKALLFPDLSGLEDRALFFVNADGSGLRRLASVESFFSDAQISPDGTQIVFVSNRDGSEDLYLIKIDGSNVRRLTKNSAFEIDPAWSPDGNWIVFASNRGSGLTMNNYDLYVMSPDGTNQCQLTKGEDTEWEPVWSPDGQWIAYISLSKHQVYLVRPDGQDPHPWQLPVEVEDLYSLDWAAGK